MPPFLLVELAEACSEQQEVLQPQAGGAALLDVSLEPLELLSPRLALLVVLLLELVGRAPLLEPPRELLVSVEVSPLLDPVLLLLPELPPVPATPSSGSQ